MTKDELGDRQKEYEENYDIKLPKFLPILIRIDAKSFHTFTRGMQRPFDEILTKTMWDTAIYLCENIQNAKIAYTQSDEITVLMYQSKIESQPWFDNRLQKIVSISASMATLAFNEAFVKNVEEEYQEILKFCNIESHPKPFADEADEYYENKMDMYEIYQNKFGQAKFDSRVMVIPECDVNNNFLWRQMDAERNSKQMICQSLYSSKQLHGKKANVQMDLMFAKGINWNDIETYKKRGACIIKEKYMKGEVERSRWTVDKDIPIFSENPKYIEKYLTRQ